MNRFREPSELATLKVTPPLQQNLALVFNSEVVRNDPVIQRIIAGLPLCEGIAEINTLLDQLCIRLIHIKDSLQVKDNPPTSIQLQFQPRRLANRGRLTIRL